MLWPIAIFGAHRAFLEARGPFWLGTNSDPSYPYLLNSLRLAEGQPPTHLDHPGLTVHLLGAAVLKGAHAAAGRPAPLVEDVLRDPEWYARAVVAVFLALHAGALVMAGLLVLKATERPALAFVVQATSLLSPSSLFELTDLKPEPLLYTLSALLAATVCATLLHREMRPGLLVVLLAVLTGAALASKFTAVSLAAIPLVVLAGVRERTAWALGSAATFLACAAPAWPEWRRAATFLGRMARGAGLYGQGLFAQDLPYADRLRRVLAEEVVFFAALLAGLAAAAVARARHRRVPAPPARRRALTALWALLAVGATQVALVLKHPYQPRYLLPALGLTGLLLALAAWLVCWDHQGRRDSRACAVALAFGATATAIQAPRFWRRVAQVRGAAECQLRSREKAEAAAGCALVTYYRASSLPLALYQADAWAGRAFATRLAKRHPSESFLAPDGSLENFTRRVEPGELSGHLCVVLQGSPGGPGRPFSPLAALDRAALPVAGAFRVRSSCPWEAVIEIRQASDSTGSPLRMGSRP